MIGLGVVTYNCPSRYERCVRSLFQQLNDEVSVWAFYEDGSLPEHRPYYLRAADYLEEDWGIPNLTLSDGVNRGVAYAKNQLITALLASDATDIFIVEDDMLCLSPKAVTEYARVARDTGIGHFSFAHHGPINKDGPLGTDGEVELYHGCVGSWCYYSRDCLLSVGLMDEHFRNAYDHVEHTFRCAKAGFTTPFWRFADVAGSADWIKEQPDSFDTTQIHKGPGWIANINRSLKYWRDKDKDCPV